MGCVFSKCADDQPQISEPAKEGKRPHQEQGTSSSSNSYPARSAPVTSPERAQRQRQKISFDVKDLSELDVLLEEIENLLKESNKITRTMIPHRSSPRLSDNTANNIKMAGDWFGQLSDFAKQIKGSDLVKELSTGVTNTLGAVGSLHWAGAGLWFIYWAVKRMEQTNANYEQCYSTMSKLVALWKNVRKLLNVEEEQIQEHVEKGTNIIAAGVVYCCDLLESGKLSRTVIADTDHTNLAQIEKEIDQFRAELATTILVDLHISMEDAKTVPKPSKGKSEGIQVGLDERVPEVTARLNYQERDKVLAVVLHGMGGIGKTTLARAVYEGIPFTGRNFCRVGMEETPSEDSILALQKEMIEDLTGQNMKDVVDRERVRNKLGQVLGSLDPRKPIFMYIDNVLKPDYLKSLLPDNMQLPEGSRVMLTTRYNKEALKAVLQDKHSGIQVKMYEVNLLTTEEAITLLCLHIFKAKNPPSSFKNMSLLTKSAHACGNLPLALEVLGTYLRRFKDDPKELIRGLKRAIDVLAKYGSSASLDGTAENKVSAVLKFSYDQLSEEGKRAFLLVSTCLVGNEMRWEDASDVVETLWPMVSLEMLEGWALVKKAHGYRVDMHDLLITMGRTLAEKEGLTLTEDALQQGEGINEKMLGTIEWLQVKKPLEVEVLNKCEKLRVLIIGDIIGHCKNVPENLRVLHFQKVLENPWDLHRLKHLTYLNYRHDFSNKTRLAYPQVSNSLQVLRNWTGEELPEEFTRSSSKLRKLTCIGLHKLPADFGRVASKLEDLRLYDSSLTELPESSLLLEALETLELQHCPLMKELPPGFGNLTALSSLNISQCVSLCTLPADFGQLKSLESLTIDRCERFESLPVGFGELESLRSLRLESLPAMKELPSSIGELRFLEYLRVWDCECLESWTVDFGLTPLHTLDVRGCPRLQDLQASLESLVTSATLQCLTLPEDFPVPEYFTHFTGLHRENLPFMLELSKIVAG